MTVRWCDPPAHNTRIDGWAARLAPVMEQPGEWALVRDFDRESSARCAVRDLRNGRLQRPPGVWEFRSAKTHESFGLWAKYLGVCT